jgi:hypothetical protein
MVYLQYLKSMKIKINWDAMGIATSVACAIHCAILPIVLTSLPVLGINIIHNNFFEWGMIGVAFVVGTTALLHGYKRHHRSLIPMAIFSGGFCFLILKQFMPKLEHWFLAAAVLLIVSAHFYNYKICNQCKAPDHGH